MALLDIVCNIEDCGHFEAVRGNSGTVVDSVAKDANIVELPSITGGGEYGYGVA